jgi:hypothetical protein
MMTRETKIGLGVAFSFLCLLGVVLAGKYTTLFGTPPSDADVQVAFNDNSDPAKAPEKSKKDPPATTETLPPLQPVPNDPPVVQTGGTNLDDLPPLPVVKNDKPAPTVSDPIPVTRPKDSKPTDEAPALPDTAKAGKTDEKNPDDLPALPSVVEPSVDPESKPPVKKDKPAPESESSTPDGKSTGKDDNKLPPLPDKDPTKKAEPATEANIELPPPPPIKKNTQDSPTSPATKPIPPLPLPTDNPPAKATAPARTGDKDSAEATVPDNPQVALGKPVQGAGADSSRIPSRSGEPLRATNPMTATPTSRVPARSASGTTPRVESFDEETYRPRPDDNFASISKKYYQSDKYAQALLLFNREHPRAGESLRRDPPDLTGQAVYIPPIHVLEKRHGNVIEGYTPATNPVPAPRDTPRRETPPTGTGAGAYQVSPNGETMMEIARTRLGNGDRWREIQQLNPGWRPDYPIPGGTTLRLPGDPRGTP